MNLLSHITIAGAFSHAVEVAHRNQIADEHPAPKAPVKRLSLSLPFAALWMSRSA